MNMSPLMHWFGIVAIALSLMACNRVAPDWSHLAMVDYWPAERLLFVAAKNSGAVAVLRVPNDGQHTSLEFVTNLDQPPRRTVVRLVMDRARSRLWVADEKQVHVYDYRRAGQPSASVLVLPDDEHLTITDLIVDEHGDALVQLSWGLRLYRARGDAPILEHWLNAFPQVAPNTPLSADTRRRLVQTQDHRYIIAPSPFYGGLTKIDTRSKAVSFVNVSPATELGCSLLFRQEGSDSLRAVDCMSASGANIHFNGSTNSALAEYVRH